jgi:hypothetical protein
LAAAIAVMDQAAVMHKSPIMECLLQRVEYKAGMRSWPFSLRASVRRHARRTYTEDFLQYRDRSQCRHTQSGGRRTG